MKKFLIPVLLLAAGNNFAQDMGNDTVPKNKKGNEILPRKGDLAIGFNTIPLLNVIFNVIKPESPGAENIVQYTSNMNNQFTGKYFLDAKTAIRVRFGVNTLSGSVINRVQDAEGMYKASLGTADDIAKASLLRVEDKLKFSKSNVLLSIGYEKRRGYRRLQGFYGAELGFGVTSAKQKISYGNAMSDRHSVFYTDNFYTATTATINPTGAARSSRELEHEYRGGFRAGIRGFIGIEYFIFTKISVAAEYGWGYSISRRRGAELTREVYNVGQNGPEVFTEEVETDSRELLRGFAVDNNNGSAFSLTNTTGGNTSLNGGAGALTLLFHF